MDACGLSNEIARGPSASSQKAGESSVNANRVKRAERLEAEGRIALGNHDVGVVLERCLMQSAQQLCGDKRHVPGDDEQIIARYECGLNAS